MDLEQEFSQHIYTKELTTNIAMHLLVDYLIDELLDTGREKLLIDLAELSEKTKGLHLAFKFRDDGTILEVALTDEEGITSEAGSEN